MKNQRKDGFVNCVLCALVLLGVMGCSKSTPEGGTALEKDGTKNLDISIAVLDNVADGEWNNAYHQYFMNKFNIKWDYNYVEWGSWQEKLRIWINAGDLPDLSIWDYNYSDVVNYVEQGLLYKFPADWKQRWPNAAKAYNSSPLNLELEKQFGGTYVMLRPIFVYNKQSDPIVNQIGVIGIRKDWAKAVGFELKDVYTVNETFEFARLVKEKDPGKAGNALLPLSYDPRNALTCIISANSRHSRAETAFYKNAAGKYQWGGADEETFMALERYKYAYDQGLLPVEFYLMDDNDKEKFYVNGTAALYHLGGVADFRQTADTEMRNNLGLNSDDVLHEAIVLGNDSKYHNIILGSNFWSSLIFSPGIKTENFERLMDFIDFTCTEEGQIICNMGFEGQDWEYRDNRPISILPADTSILDKYGSRIESIYILEDDFAVINPAIKEQYRVRMNGIAALKLQYGRGEYSDIDWKLELHNSRAKDQAALEYHTEYANLILQPGNLRANWERWVAEKMRVIEPYLNELNGL